MDHGSFVHENRLGGRFDKTGFINVEIRLDNIWVTSGDDEWLRMPESDPIQSVRPLGIDLKHTRSIDTRVVIYRY